MKRILALLLVSTLFVMLVSCGGGTGASSSEASSTPVSSEESSSEESSSEISSQAVSSQAPDPFEFLMDIGPVPKVSLPEEMLVPDIREGGKWIADNCVTFKDDTIICASEVDARAFYAKQALGDEWSLSTNWRPIKSYPDDKPISSRISFFGEENDILMILTFSLSEGQYLAQLQINITDADGKSEWKTLYDSQEWAETASTLFHSAISREKGSKNLKFTLAGDKGTYAKDKSTVTGSIPDGFLDKLKAVAFCANAAAIQYYNVKFESNGPTKFKLGAFDIG